LSNLKVPNSQQPHCSCTFENLQTLSVFEMTQHLT
jgi:hypothetical protein